MTQRYPLKPQYSDGAALPQEGVRSDHPLMREARASLADSLFNVRSFHFSWDRLPRAANVVTTNTGVPWGYVFGRVRTPPYSSGSLLLLGGSCYMLPPDVAGAGIQGVSSYAGAGTALPWGASDGTAAAVAITVGRNDPIETWTPFNLAIPGLSRGATAAGNIQQASPASNPAEMVFVQHFPGGQLADSRASAPGARVPFAFGPGAVRMPPDTNLDLVLMLPAAMAYLDPTVLHYICGIFSAEIYLGEVRPSVTIPGA